MMIRGLGQDEQKTYDPIYPSSGQVGIFAGTPVAPVYLEGAKVNPVGAVPIEEAANIANPVIAPPAVQIIPDVPNEVTIVSSGAALLAARALIGF